MAIRPRTITIVIFLLVFASATSAMQTEGADYQDPEVLDDFSSYAIEAWNYVSPSLEPLAELLCAQATNNNSPLCNVSPTLSTGPAQFHEPYQDAMRDTQQDIFFPQPTSQAELGYPSPSAAHGPPHLYSQASLFSPASPAMHNVEWTMPHFEAQPVTYSDADTQTWIENAYATGQRVLPAAMPQANWSELQQITPGQNLEDRRSSLAPAPPSTPFTSTSGEQSMQQFVDTFNTPALFTCDHHGCQFSSQTIQSLRHHQRYHIPEQDRPYPCSQCPRRFHCPREVQRHRITHTLERRFFCSVPSCLYATKGFGRKDHLTRHSRAKHPTAASQPTDTSSSTGNTSSS